MKIQENVPGWVEGGEPREAEFADMQGLLAIAWVGDRAARAGFHRFSVAPFSRVPGHFLLMEEVEGGRRWHVVGMIDGKPDWLPAWEAPVNGG